MYSDPTGCFSLGEMSAAMSIQMTLDNMYDLHLSGMISGLTSMIYTVLKGGGADDIIESYMKGYAAGMVYAGLGKLAMVSKSVRLIMAIASLGAIGMGYYQAWKDYKAGDKEAATYLVVLSSIGAVGWAREYGGDVVDFVGSRVEAAGGTGNNAGAGGTGQIQYAKTSFWERITTKKVSVDKLVGNPKDEFMNPKIGPSDTALSKHINYIKQNGTIDEPILVKKLLEGAYEIQNGYHRWLAAQKMGLEDILVEVMK